MIGVGRSRKPLVFFSPAGAGQSRAGTQKRIVTQGGQRTLAKRMAVSWCQSVEVGENMLSGRSLSYSHPMYTCGISERI